MASAISAFTQQLVSYGSMWEKIYNATPKECHEALHEIQRDNFPTLPKQQDVLAQTPAAKPVDVLAQPPTTTTVVTPKAFRAAPPTDQAAPAADSQEFPTLVQAATSDWDRPASTTTVSTWADEGEEEDGSYAGIAAHPPTEEALAHQAEQAAFATPKQRAPKKPKACNFGSNCNNARCTFGHPEGWDASQNIPACSYGTKCRSKFCYKRHPDGYNPLNHINDCHHGNKCYAHKAYLEERSEKDCIFIHPGELDM